MSDTLELVKSILVEKFQPEGTPTAETSLEDLGLDSLDKVNFLFSLEDATGVEIPDEDLEEKGLTTLGKLATYVDAKKG